MDSDIVKELNKAIILLADGLSQKYSEAIAVIPKENVYLRFFLLTKNKEMQTGSYSALRQSKELSPLAELSLETLSAFLQSKNRALFGTGYAVTHLATQTDMALILIENDALSTFKMDTIDTNRVMRVILERYATIIYVNFSENTYRFLCNNQKVFAHINASGSVDDLFETSKKVCHPEHRGHFSESCCPQKLMEADRNGQKRIYMEQYILCADGTYHWATTILHFLDRDPAHPCHALLFCSLSDHEMAQKIQQQNANEQLISIGRDMYSIFINIDPEADIYNMYRFGHGEDTLSDGCYSLDFPNLCKNMHPYYRERIEELLSLPALKRRLECKETEPFSLRIPFYVQGTEKIMHIYIHFTKAYEKYRILIAVKDATAEEKQRQSETEIMEAMQLLGGANCAAALLGTDTYKLQFLRSLDANNPKFSTEMYFDDMVQIFCDSYVFQDDRQKVRKAFMRAAIQRKIEVNGIYETEFRRKFGSDYGWSKWLFSRLPSSETTLLIQEQNITEQKNAEIAHNLEAQRRQNLEEKNQQLKILASTDQVTGLLNRVGLQSYQQTFEAKKQHSAVCIYLDINGLHEFNNRFGHDAGDRMLRSFSTSLLNYFPKDATFRMGGDEFLIICINVDPKEIDHCLDCFHNDMEMLNFSYSMGLEYREKNIELEEMIKIADERMFYDKTIHYQNFNRR